MMEFVVVMSINEKNTPNTAAIRSGTILEDIIKLFYQLELF
jgi:hypothetical protein